MAEDKSPAPEKRSTIIDAVTDWRKLISLVALILESCLGYAMFKTPPENPNFFWYPVMMFVLVVIVVLVLIFDRYSERNTSTHILEIEGREVKINRMNPDAVANEEHTEGAFSDSHLGIKFTMPKMEGWGKPEYLTYEALMKVFGIFKGNEFEEMKKTSGFVPFTEMFANSTTVLSQYGKPMVVELTDFSSNNASEYAIKNYAGLLQRALTEVEMKQIRHSIVKGEANLDKLTFINGFLIQVLEKNDKYNEVATPYLPNLHAYLLANTQEHLTELIAGPDSISIVSKNELKNVKVENVEQEIIIYRMNRYLESSSKLYQVQVQWSPQSNSAIQVWDELKRMFESFQVLKS
jgi:hypothetical protein